MNQPVKRITRLAGVLVASLLATKAIAQPVITSLAPTNAAAGATVVINGTGFAASATQNAVYFGTARAAVTSVSATQLTVQVPVGASSIAPVTVTDLTNRQVGSSLNSTTPFFTVRFAGNGVNANSYQNTSYPVATPRSASSNLVAADFNADNYADFATTTNSELLLTLSNGQGGYEPAIALPAGTQPRYLKAADVDADGDIDLLVGTYNQLLLLRNQGNSNGFASATALNLGGESLQNSGSLSVDVEDMNSDGLPDIITTITDQSGPILGGGQLIELHNNGNGFDAPTVLIRERVSGQVVADFNQDRRLDVLVSSPPSGSSDAPLRLLMFARNPTNTGYAAPESTVTSSRTQLYVVPLVADMNADGQPDLVISGAAATSTSRAVFVALRTTSGFALQNPIPITDQLQAIMDADGDGLPDVVTRTYNGFEVLRGQAGGSFSPPVGYAIASGFQVTNMVTGDFDNDGRSDVASFSLSNGNLTIFRYTGANANTNNAPTLNALADLTLNEDDPQQSIALSGISNGGDAGQAVTLTAVSSDPSLVPNPTISYFSPTSTGTLRLRPAHNAFGTCTITVTASDGQAQSGTITRTFQVTINPVNDAPTLDPIPDVVITTVENGSRSVNTILSGITSGATNESQIISLNVATSSMSGTLSGNGTIVYTSPSTSGEHRYNVSINGGSARLISTVTITASDGQSTNSITSRTFRIYYNPGGIDPNQPAVAPTLDPLANLTADRSLASQVPVALSGIGDGDPNLVLPLTVTATSSDPTLVTLGSANYTNPSTTGSLPYTISSTRSGTATISVTVSNGQSQNGSSTRSFLITVPQVLGTSAAHATAAKSVNLYPNPAPTGRFWLKSEVAGPADVTIIDLTGRIVGQHRLTSLLQPQQLQLPSAATGMYMVRVRTATGTTTHRMTVE